MSWKCGQCERWIADDKGICPYCNPAKDVIYTLASMLTKQADRLKGTGQ